MFLKNYFCVGQNQRDNSAFLYICESEPMTKALQLIAEGVYKTTRHMDNCSHYVYFKFSFLTQV